MGKKKKSTNSVCATFSEPDSLLDNVINHLLLIKEENGLVIGTNAVLRELEKNSVDIVLLISRKTSSILYQTLNLWCSNTGALFYQLPNMNIIGLKFKIKESTTYGIKISALIGKKEFSKLLENINKEKDVLKSKRDNLSRYNTLEICEDFKTFSQIDMLSRVKNDTKDVKSYCHKKHHGTKSKYIENDESFVSLNLETESDFPNYSSFSNNKFSISIQK